MQRNWWIWLLGPAAVTTALLVTFVVVTGGDDDDPSRPAAATSTRTSTTAPPAPPPVTTSTTSTRPPATTTTPTATTTTRRDSVVTVPDLYGTTQRQALDLLRTTGFRGRAKRERSFAPEGLVFKQTPKPGKRSRQGTTVSFTVAFFPPRTPPPLEPAAPPVSELPPVVGLDYSEAATRMEVLGVVADTYPVRSSRRVTYIVRQTPAPGTRVDRGSRVKLTVSTGSGELPEFEVPDTVGFEELRAHAICREGNFTCRTIVVSEGPPGRVVRQDPPAGQERRALAQMKLYVGG